MESIKRIASGIALAPGRLGNPSTGNNGAGACHKEAAWQE